MNCIRVLAILFSFGLFAQELPPIQNYAPVLYNGENQNWSITQSEDKLIYIANNKSLLEFNGSSWTKYPSPNETVIRSVKAVDNRIYSGAYMEFGYWQKDVFGILQYTSLSAKVKVDFLPDEEFWSIWKIEDWVVFQSLERIYIYNLKDDSIYNIDSETSVPSLFSVNQNIYFQKKYEGIFKIESGQASLVFNDSAVVDDEVVGVFQDKSDLLVLTRDNGFYKSTDEGLIKWNIPADSLLNTVSVYTSLQLRDGSIALGTISHGLILLDGNGDLIYHIGQVNGLQNNTVLSLFEDFKNNLWLGLNNGISYINLKSPFKVYHDNRGVVGSVYATAVIGDMMYLGTNQGLFYKNKQDISDFSLISGTQGQVWSLNEIDGTLFCGHHTGTFVVDADNASKIANVRGTWTVKRIAENPNRLLQGNYDGLYVLENEGGRWQLKNKIRGFDHSSRYVENHDGNIFVNHEYKGVFKIDVDDSMSTAGSVQVDTVLIGSNSGLVKYKGDLLYASKKGILKYDSVQDTFFKDSILSLAYSQAEYVSGKLLVDKRNRYLWIQTDSNIGYFVEGTLDGTPRLQSIPLTENMRDGIVGYENISVLNNTDTYLFGNNLGYFTVAINELVKPNFTVEIGSIFSSGIGNEKNIYDKRIEGSFETVQNNIEISFYTPEFAKFSIPEYQYKLEGIYEEWSDWSLEPQVYFKNLRPGEYTFKLRSRVGDTLSTNVATYSFSIAKPWYFSNLMLVVYILGGFLASMAIHNIYKRYYSKRQQKLIDENKREMELAKAQSEKEIIELKNEQLKKEFQSKSNELAASTMSIIKKNELLSKAKEQLMANVGEKEVKPIIDIIDRNLNQNDDWELFKEAFNNADRKFLKKLKKVHPNLSPNDIKLCAYLRLNLSSKEIAPLLNISARSVEIKRYRLRKKMGLEHDDNLVNYILKL
ncbi:triple tyrosine motif-containing protein [Flagellimonas sp.]|uniref:helix-turn-helix and ligand-binding sensor domain-containing protein n=1 Tax=Flagellimonas sp. TaxID=2058762 RepID=UPI003F4A29FD